jgi:hypothetical protein
MAETYIETVETRDAAISISGHKKNLSGKAVYAYAFPDDSSTPKRQIGSATGTANGKEFLINVDFDFPPGEYDVEIVDKDGYVLHPNAQDNIEIKLLNAKFND